MSPAAQLTSVRSVGALLPVDVLGRVAAGDPDLGGLRSADYHLGAGETPREAANRAWAYLLSVWPSFREAMAALPAGDPAVRLTRERWLLLLFRELGYGRLQTTPAGGLNAGEKFYPVSHEWGPLPIHLLGWGVDLDRRTKGVPGAAERAPHAMVQELCNRSEDHLWAVVSNGQVLRLLRDSTSLSTVSFVEFDLEAIFDGELFADFVVLFLLLHQSRVEVPEGGAPADCWLERWRSSAIAQGTRAMALLRDGVQRAIEHLGTGFMRAPANTELRDGLADGSLALADVHQGLLRLVYRLLFLFVAEDRDALLAPDAAPVAKARYRDYYSTARLRRLALKRRGTAHTDLWRAQRLVIAKLGDEAGCPELGLPGIGGLFDDQGAEVFADADLPNDALLAAVRDLAVVRPAGQPQRLVDYKNLGAEELGSIYESLLELVPRHDPVHQTFALVTLAGNDRKTTGSYYTPSALIDLLLDETLDPLLDDAERAADPEATLLAMTVCDPACGSGHFLVAAARRIAERLAVVRSGESDPTPTHLRAALHDVVDRCIYGVDLNPLAAELAKVSLWLEAMQAGRPLSFLDAHVKVGNALLGTAPELIAAGIPDDAFVALGDDDKPTTTAWKRRNKVERDARAAAQDELDLFGDAPTPTVPPAPSTTAVPGARLADVHALARRYAAWQQSPELARERLLADAWCAAFVQHKRPGDPAITTGTLDAVRDGTIPAATSAAVHGHAVALRFFHWHLEFPDVAGAGGFTAIVGNPPWERIKLQEQEFFAQRDPDVATAANAAARKRKIRALTDSDPALAAEWADASRAAEATSHYLRRSGRYPLCGVGDVNTYAVFAELFRTLLTRGGRAGIVAPTGLVTDATTSAFFSELVAARDIFAVIDFVTNPRMWTDVGNRRFRFAVICVGRGGHTGRAKLAFFLKHPDELQRGHPVMSLEPSELRMLNPNTGTCPVFSDPASARIAISVYRRFPVLIREDETRENSWGLSFLRMLDMANDSSAFLTEDELRGTGFNFDGWGFERTGSVMLPLYEAKMVGHYDSRLATYHGRAAGSQDSELPRLTDSEHCDPHCEPLARYWLSDASVRERLDARWTQRWLLGWRGIARNSDRRTLISTVIPRSAVSGKFPLALLREPEHAPLLQAIWSSLACDFVVRQKLAGTDVALFVIKQVAMPRPEDLGARPRFLSASFADFLRARVLELTYTHWRLSAFAEMIEGQARPPFIWDPLRREVLSAEIEGAIFHLYGLEREEVNHILTTFHALAAHETRERGEFRTKRLILAAYDAMAAAASAGTTYVTPLDPPPGEGPRHPAERHRDEQQR